MLGVDVNPAAVEASRANAARNRVADRTDFAVSDLFEAVAGDFDLVVIDLPFRWFSPCSSCPERHEVAVEGFGGLSD